MSYPVKIHGEQQAGLEIQKFLSAWDEVVCQLDIQLIVGYCTADVCFFDTSSQTNGILAYQALWQRYSSVFQSNIRVFRRDVLIHATESMGFISCYSKVDRNDGIETPEIPWCRSTLAVRKTTQGWKIQHQHISLPVDFATQRAIPLHF